MGIENIRGLDDVIKSEKINKKVGMFWCDDCNKEINQDNLIFDDETDSFICNICGNFVKYILKR